MDNNTFWIIFILFIIAIITVFILGYFYAMSKTENRMINMQIKMAEAKLNTIKQMQNIKAIEVKEEDLPKEIKSFLEFLDKEEENEKSKKDRH